MPLWMSFPSVDCPLNVIPQFEFQGMGLQVNLVFQIGLIVFAHVMLKQGNRDDQGDQALFVMIDDFQQFLFFSGRQILFEITQHVHQHIGVLFWGGFYLEGFQKDFLIGLKPPLQWQGFLLGHQRAQPTVMDGTVRHQ
jgi:hypothetical protein